MKGQLTEDQRWLLFGVGGWQMTNALADEKWGVSALFSGQSGSTHLHRIAYEARPHWVGRGYSINGSTIYHGWHARAEVDSAVSVTRAALVAFARALPADLKREVQQCQRLNGCVATDWWRSWHTSRQQTMPLDLRRPAWSKQRLRSGREVYRARHAQFQADTLLRVLGLSVAPPALPEPTDLLELLELMNA